MKIKHLTDYISIKKFDPIEIEDFSIITGLNGSGKTHLLKALKSGHVLIEGIDRSEIVYYNYNDFAVFTGNLEQDQIIKNRVNQWKNEQRLFSDNVGKLKNIATKEAQKNLSLTDKVIYGFANELNYNFDNLFGIKKDYELLEELKTQENFKENLENFKGKFTPYFFLFLQQYLMIPEVNIDDINLEILRPRFEKISNIFEIEFKKTNKDVYDFLKSSVDNKSIWSINANDYETPNFFLEDIAIEEKTYQFLRVNNSLNKVKKLDWNENVEYLEKNDFIKKYGFSPIEQINEVLNEYDCNGYFLCTNEIQHKLGVDISTFNIQITLQQKDAGYETNFDQLSSGERTLIALSLLIHKSRKNRVMPRVLLLDEIDSSLHPSMIKRLLSVIQELFIKTQGFKIILATHSPTTIALSPENSIYILNKYGNNKITKQEKSIALNILTEGFATLNNDNTNLSIEYNISQTELPILFTEGITNKIIIEKAWEKLYINKKMPFYVQDCFDAKFLGNLLRRGYDEQDGIFITHSNKILMSLFDFDSAGYNAWNSLNKQLPNIIEHNPLKCLTRQNNEKNGYALLLPVPNNQDIKKQIIKQGNKTYEDNSSLSIELLFYGYPELEKYFSEKQISGGGKIIHFTGNKRDFSKKISNLDMKHFDSFYPLFEKILSII